MQPDFLKFRKVITSIACSPLMLISNNSELAAKYLSNDSGEFLKAHDINVVENNLKVNTAHIETIHAYTNDQNLVGNRRPFSNGEIFSLFLLIIIIFLSLMLSIAIASLTGKEIDSIPIWLVP